MNELLRDWQNSTREWSRYSHASGRRRLGVCSWFKAGRGGNGSLGRRSGWKRAPRQQVEMRLTGLQEIQADNSRSGGSVVITSSVFCEEREEEVAAAGVEEMSLARLGELVF